MEIEGLKFTVFSNISSTFWGEKHRKKSRQNSKNKICFESKTKQRRLKTVQEELIHRQTVGIKISS